LNFILQKKHVKVLTHSTGKCDLNRNRVIADVISGNEVIVKYSEPLSQCNWRCKKTALEGRSLQDNEVELNATAASQGTPRIATTH
jgi:hypothetical protein